MFNFKSCVMFYFCCIYPASLILNLMAHYVPMKLLLIYTGKSKSRVKAFVLSIPIYTASGREIQCLLCQWDELALLLHCHGFLKRWLKGQSPAGTEHKGWAQIFRAMVVQHCVWAECFILGLKVAEFFFHCVLLGEHYSSNAVQCWQGRSCGNGRAGDVLIQKIPANNVVGCAFIKCWRRLPLW